MTEAIFECNKDDLLVELRVRGHAGFAEIGRDIVCAGVSILAYTAARVALEHKAEGAEVYMRTESGDVCVEVKCSDETTYERCVTQMHVVELGYRLLAQAYPEYVSLNDSS